MGQPTYSMHFFKFTFLHIYPEDFQTKGSVSSHTVTAFLAELDFSLGTI